MTTKNSSLYFIIENMAVYISLWLIRSKLEKLTRSQSHGLHVTPMTTKNSSLYFYHRKYGSLYITPWLIRSKSEKLTRSQSHGLHVTPMIPKNSSLYFYHRNMAVYIIPWLMAILFDLSFNKSQDKNLIYKSV